MLSEEEVKKYQKTHKETYGEEISYEEAYEAATNLIGFFQLLLDIDRKNKSKNRNK